MDIIIHEKFLPTKYFQTMVYLHDTVYRNNLPLVAIYVPYRLSNFGVSDFQLLRFSIFYFSDFAHACSRHYIMNFIKSIIGG